MNNNLEFLGNVKPSENILNFELEIWKKYLSRKNSILISLPEFKKILHPSISWQINIGNVSNKSLDNESTQRPYSIECYNGNAPSWVIDIINYLNEESLKQSSELNPVSYHAPTKEFEEKIHQAVEVIKSCVPDYNLLIQKMTRTIVICTGEDFVGATVPYALGLIAMSPKKDWNLAMYIDTIIHEASHTELFIRQLIDPLVTGEKFISSPFRELVRPQSGVLHAAFVLFRVSDVLDKIRKNNEIETSIKEGCEKLLKENKELFEISIKELKEFAQFTNWGKKLFNELEKGW